MTKEYVMDAKGGGFVPFALSRMHRSSLQRAILEAVTSVPGSIHDALQCYSPELTVWDIPPLVAGKLRGVSLQIAPDTAIVTPSKVLRDFDQLLEGFIAKGWTLNLEKALVSRFGDLAKSPVVFDRDNTDPRRFVMEYIVAASRRLYLGLIAHESTFAMRYITDNGEVLKGIVDGKLLGTELTMTAQEINDFLYQSRGVVTTHHHGIYDRLQIWASMSYGVIHDADEVRMALTLLKLCGNIEEEALFETRLRNSEMAVVNMSNNLMTDELADDIRAMWLEGNSTSPEEALRAIADKLVPDVIDSVILKKYLRVLPSDKKLSKREVGLVTVGIDRLAQDIFSKHLKNQNARKSSRRS